MRKYIGINTEKCEDFSFLVRQQANWGSVAENIREGKEVQVYRKGGGDGGVGADKRLGKYPRG